VSDNKDTETATLLEASTVVVVSLLAYSLTMAYVTDVEIGV
jgi:hypothetical protein